MQMFLSTHTGEVLFLDFQHLYNFSESQHSALVELIRKVFGSLICPPQAPDNLNLSYLVRNEQQVSYACLIL